MLKVEYISGYSILNNSVDNGFFQQLIIQYIDHIRYSYVACNGFYFGS